MKKLCFVISSMSRGGAERVMSILLNASVNMGYEVHLILLSSKTVNYDLDERINIIDIPSRIHKAKGLSVFFKRVSTLKKTILEINPDLVVSFLTTCNMYTCLALRGTKIPLIISERNDPIKDCPNPIKRLLRDYCYKFASGYIFQTDEAMSHFSRRIQQNGVVIPNPVKGDLPDANVTSYSKAVVAAARLTAQKNYPMLLRAFSRFSRDFPEYILQIYGDGDKRDELVLLTQELGISDKVVFEGNVSDLHDRIKNARMFVLSSDYEGISNSLLEAMSMGLPCISTDCPCGGSRMLIENEVSGLLTPVGDDYAFYMAMKRIGESDEFAVLLSQNARRTRNVFSEETILDKYFGFFKLHISEG